MISRQLHGFLLNLLREYARANNLLVLRYKLLQECADVVSQGYFQYGLLILRRVVEAFNLLQSVKNIHQSHQVLAILVDVKLKKWFQTQHCVKKNTIDGEIMLTVIGDSLDNENFIKVLERLGLSLDVILKVVEERQQYIRCPNSCWHKFTERHLVNLVSTRF